MSSMIVSMRPRMKMALWALSGESASSSFGMLSLTAIAAARAGWRYRNPPVSSWAAMYLTAPSNGCRRVGLGQRGAPRRNVLGGAELRTEPPSGSWWCVRRQATVRWVAFLRLVT